MISCTNKDDNKSGALLKGLDVSHFQGKVDWKEVKKAGYAFVFIKATQGKNYKDHTFTKNRQTLHEIGIPAGAYHFYESNYDPIKQANHFIETIGKLNKGELPPVLDVENGGIKGKVNIENLNKDILKFLKHVEKKLKVKPVIYGNYPFFTKYLTNSKFKKYPLWISDYDAKEPKMPMQWKRWTFWQYTSHREVDGIRNKVDGSYFNGDIKKLKRLKR